MRFYTLPPCIHPDGGFIGIINGEMQAAAFFSLLCHFDDEKCNVNEVPEFTNG